jgi:hypothetical protein
MGEYKNCIWLCAVPQGLKDQNGTTFYAPDAPEMQVIKFMAKVSDAAQKFYTIKADYPNYANDIETGSYSNPFTGAMEPLVVFSGVDKNTDADREAPLDTSLKSGGMYNSETALHPGAVHAYSVIGHPLADAGDSSSYSWGVHCFYIHGCDKAGNLLSGSSPGKALLVTLKNGQVVNTADPSAAAPFAKGDFVLSPVPPPDANFVQYKWLGGLIGFIIFAIFLSRSTRIGRRRKLF